MKELDKKMAIKNSKYQEEMNQVQDSHKLEVAGLLSEHRELTTKLREKVEQLEMMSWSSLETYEDIETKGI